MMTIREQRVAAFEQLLEITGGLKELGIPYTRMYERISEVAPELEMTYMRFYFAVTGRAMAQCPAILEALKRAMAKELSMVSA